jgi:GTPase Era involved in 16S rRNA processing
VSPPTDVPTFAVVGRVNKGKSSVIASLIEDDGVKISPRPGTTTECVEYAVEAEGRMLFRVIDTPGFEDAPKALHWIKQREVTAADRAGRIRELLDELQGTDELVQERKLLAPIRNGAAILYVVNGDEPYRPNYEAEMEVLRYTGQPAMALINRSENGRYVGDWELALNQYFKLVRTFDAHHVTWIDRRRLLEAFAVLEPKWETKLTEAVALLDAEQERRLLRVASIITKLIVDALTLHLTVLIPHDTTLELETKRLEGRFHDDLRKREARAHREIGEVYLHSLSHWTPETEIELDSEGDLFAKETWRVMGLSPRALLALTTATGAVAGGAVDAMTGLSSFLTGTVLGGLGGLGVGVYELTRRFASASNLRDRATDALRGSREGEWIRVGPHPSTNFPFVVLSRAVNHFDRVRAWSHAKRDLSALPPSAESVVDELDASSRRELNKLFSTIRKKYRGVPDDTRGELNRAIYDVLASHLGAGSRARD